MIFIWKWNKNLKQWDLKSCFGFGRSCATVWNNGTWHTWNKLGIGGENSKETSVSLAMKEAKLSAISQGFI